MTTTQIHLQLEISWESTASALSNIHFGHYMAGISSDTMTHINAMLADYPLLTGLMPDRWLCTLNVMLEKIPGNNLVEKLRIIMLFEGDFNNNNKWIGQAVMKYVEKNNRIAQEQYGSQKRKVAWTQCLNKCLFYNWIRTTKQPAALCSNNAKSCYDCTVLVIAVLCLCQLGATKTAIRSMISTLANLKHHVCTAFGDSPQSQGQTNWLELVTGIGQGNGAGP